ncbi:histidyl-tRNA synthetase, partial [Thraustotheca clavata]
MTSKVTVSIKKLSLEELSAVAFCGAKVAIEPFVPVALSPELATKAVDLTSPVTASTSLPKGIARALLVSRLNYILKHAELRSEAALSTADFLVHLLNEDIVPILPLPTSAGGAVDAAALVLLDAFRGNGTVQTGRGVVALKDVLGKTALPKELAPIEKATFAQGHATLEAIVVATVAGAKGLLPISDAVAALTCEVTKAQTAPFNVEFHDATRPHRGIITSATNLRAMLDGSKATNAQTDQQDAEAIRCIPQYHGPARETIANAAKSIELELNSIDPSLYSNSRESVGAFHPELLKTTLSAIQVALQSLAQGSTDRLSILTHTALSPVSFKNISLISTFEFLQSTVGVFEHELKVALQRLSDMDEAMAAAANRAANAGISAAALQAMKEAEAKEDAKLAQMPEAQRLKILEKRRLKAEKAKEKQSKKAAKDELRYGAGTTELRDFLSTREAKLIPFDFRPESLYFFLEDLFARLSTMNGGQRRKPKIAKGAQDFLPHQMQLREQIFHKIRAVFKRHAGVEIETPVFELKETLTGKYGEDSKLIYDLADQGGELLALRYDLTVPFARFMALHNPGNIKRYAIARVYRRDNPQMARGRFREFYQCDFDIAGTYPLMLADAEVISIGIEVLKEFPELGSFKIKLSHRKLLDAVLDICGVPAEKIRTTCSAIDKLDKETWETVRSEMVDEKGLAPEVADRIQGFVTQVGAPRALHAKLLAEKKFGNNKNASEAMKELALLFDYLDAMGVLDYVSFDLSLARGLDYYTGLIYEFVLTGSNAGQVGSIAAGGRYDNLVGMFSATNAQIPCVGVSMGIERIFGMLQKHAEETNQAAKAAAQVLVAQTSKDMLLTRLTVCKDLWQNNIAAEIVPTENPKFVKQLQHALDAGIPYMVVLGETELKDNCVNVKVLATKEEFTVPRDQMFTIINERFLLENIAFLFLSAPLSSELTPPQCTSPPSRAAMMEKAKALAQSERLGAGKPFSKTTMGDIGELGIGIQLYFMLLKYLSYVLLLMAVCAVPSAVLHYYGHGVLAPNADPLKLTYWSIANEGVNSAIDPALCMENGGDIDCTVATISTPLTNDPKIASYIICGCDCGYSFVFWVFIGAFAYKCRRVIQNDSLEKSTPAKYAVRVQGLPRDATEKEILTHFNDLYDLTRPEHCFPLYFGCFGRQRPPRRPKKIAGSISPVTDVDHADGNKMYLDTWIAQVSIATPTGGFLRLFLGMESLMQQIAQQTDIVAAYRNYPAKYGKKLALAEAKLQQLEATMTKKTSKMKALKKDGAKRLAECECAYVVFEHVESKRRCLNDYRTSTTSWKRRWQPKALRFRQKYPLIVVSAPEPSNIIWENIETTSTSRFLRRSTTNISTFVLLLLSCGIISLANSSQSQFNTPVLQNVCSKILSVYQGPNPPAGSWDLTWNSSKECSSSSFAIEYLNQPPLPFPPGALSYNDRIPPNNLTRCIDTCFNATSSTICGTLPCFTTDKLQTSNDPSNKCEAYTPSNILTCYCNPLLEEAIHTHGVFNGAKMLWNDVPPCQSYLQAYLTKSVLLIAASLTVVFINVALQGIFYAFSSFERHSSESNKAVAVVFKLFFAQWINTAVIVLIVNANLGNVPLVSSLLSGQFKDFERSWYTSVGAGLTMTMLVNVITPQLGPFIAMYIRYPLKRFFAKYSVVTQQQMNALYASPAFDISLRYPVVLNTIFVTLMYCGGLPILLPLGAIALGLTYLLDKLTIMKLCSVRTAYDEALGSLAMKLLPWVLLLHLGFSSWMFGNSTVLQSDLISISVVLKATGLSNSVPLSSDPTAYVLNELENQMNQSDKSDVIKTIYRYLINAFLKIIRLNTFPVTFMFVVLFLWMFLSRFLVPILAPVFRLTIGLFFKALYRVFRCCRPISIRPLVAEEHIFPPFSALFERRVDSTYKSDVKKGFEVNEQGILVRRWPETIEFDGKKREKGTRLRTWEAFAAPVKTYAIEHNPKYKNAITSMLEAQEKMQATIHSPKLPPLAMTN